MKVFDFDDYKDFVNTKVRALPKKGHGQLKKIAEFLDVNSVIVSQVFRGSRDLNLEQSVKLCEYFGFSKLEQKYFLTLVQKERAGTHQLKKVFEEELEDLKQQSQKVKSRIKTYNELSESDKTAYYSHWYYGAIRLLMDIKEYDNPDSIAERLNLPMPIVSRTIDFLLERGLCSEEKGKLQVAPMMTHLDHSSPLSARHYANWRQKGIERRNHMTKDELFYVCPMTLSKEFAEKIRKRFLEVIEDTMKELKDSPPEEFYCMGIDWFKVN